VIENGLVTVFTPGEPAWLQVFPAQCGLTTPVTLEFLRAKALPEGISLEWSVRDDFGLIGFGVHRATEPGGPEVGLHPAFLPATDAPRFLDATVAPGVAYAYRLEGVDRTGRTTSLGRVTARALDPPSRIRLGPSRPNPFGAGTASVRIPVDLEESGPARLAVYDASGRRVRVLLDRALEAGSHTVSWDGRDDRGRRAVPGLYLYRLEAGGASASRRLVRIP
jgi:hypothetical protein